MKMTRLLTLILLLTATGTFASNVGQVNLPNSGSAEAQADFLRGLAQLHNFEFHSAAEDFRQAQKTDPDFALAYWGEAMTYNHPLWAQQDTEAGRNALHRLAASKKGQLSRAETSLEKDFVRATQILYGDGDKRKRDFLYRDHMAKMYERYPGDPDVGAFYALSLMGAAHQGRDFTIYMKSAAITTELFHRFPQHPGIAHYLIHATDDPVHAPLGYQAALAYSKIAPDAGHAQHMTSHIFLALGHWQASADANDNAVSVVNKQRAALGKESIGCGHYPSWQLYAYLQQSRWDEAKARMALCHERTAASDGSNRSLAGFYYMKALYLFDTEDWTGDIAAMDVPQRGSDAIEFSRLYIDATQAVRTESNAAAKMVEAAIKTGERYITSLDSNVADRDIHQADKTRVKILHLKSWLAANHGKAQQAETYLREAVALENQLPFGFGPPSPEKPSLEALADFLLSENRNIEAVETYKLALARTVNKTRSRHGLASATRASKR